MQELEIIVKKVLFLHPDNNHERVYLCEDRFHQQFRIFDNRFDERLFAQCQYIIKIEKNKLQNRTYVVSHELNLKWNVHYLQKYLEFLMGVEMTENLFRKLGKQRVLGLIQALDEDKIKENTEDKTSFFNDPLEQVIIDVTLTLIKSSKLTMLEVAYLESLKFPRPLLLEGLNTSKNIYEIISDLYSIEKAEEHNITFKQYENAYLKLGNNPINRKRSLFAVYYSFIEAEGEGHVYQKNRDLIRNYARLYAIKIPKETFLKNATNLKSSVGFYLVGNSYFPINQQMILESIYPQVSLLNIEFSDLYSDLKELIYRDLVVQEEYSKESRYYMEYKRRPFHTMESEIAEDLIQRKQSKRPHKDEKGKTFEVTKEFVADTLEAMGYEMEEKQFDFIYQNATSLGGVGFLNGGAGRGKTFTTSVFIELFEKIKPDVRVVLLAPTGRAAKRMNEMSNKPAYTIHSFITKSDVSLALGTADIYLVDETSMVDMVIFYKMLKKINKNAKIIIVGHDRQLESIGAGRIFTDIVYSEQFDGVTLEIPKRFDTSSKIYQNAENILNYNPLTLFEENEEQETIYRNDDKEILKELHKRLTKRKMDDPTFKETQILVPMYRGLVGIDFLNYYIQQKFFRENIKKNEYAVLKRSRPYPHNSTERYDVNLYKKDKVVNLKNIRGIPKYEKDEAKGFVPSKTEVGDVMNGEIGYVAGIGTYPVLIETHSGEQENKMIRGVIVSFEGDYYFFPQRRINKQIDLAYALSIYKAQGSEWSHTYLIISETHKALHRNNIMYTGFTRSSNYQCTIGNKAAIDHAIMTETKEVRNTHLLQKLQAFEEVPIDEELDVLIL